MTLACDHTSVGILVYRSGKLPLIERKKPPYGFAPPAGHVDNRPSFEAAAAAELFEEVGLTATNLERIAEGRKNNHCRRPNGSWHFWRIYKATALGAPRANCEEVKNMIWVDRSELLRLAERTERYTVGVVSEEQWKRAPGLEPIWLEWFKRIGLLNAVGANEQWSTGT